MKRFLVFAWEYYYPTGGMNDLHEEFDDEEAAIAAAKKLTDWPRVEVFDIQTGNEVWSK